LRALKKLYAFADFLWKCCQGKDSQDSTVQEKTFSLEENSLFMAQLES